MVSRALENVPGTAEAGDDTSVLPNMYYTAIY